MAVKPPTLAQLRNIAETIGLELTEDDLASFSGLLAPLISAYQLVDTMPDNLPAVKYPRTPGYRPPASENPYNAWYVKTSVKGAARGKLKGKTLVLKDNIMLAGVPMMNGASTLEGYVPEIDATVVTRILDAGGEIVGKAHCEIFVSRAAATPMPPDQCTTRASGATRRAARPREVRRSLRRVKWTWRSAAIREDRSAFRHPIVAFTDEPTHGLVPYTGIMPIEITIDHTGPMTNTVRDNALLLEVIAGADGYDPRQYNVKTHAYTKALDGGVQGLRLAVVQEGFEHANSEPEVDACVRAAAARLRDLGATVDNVSIPLHSMGQAIWSPVVVEGLTQTMMWGDGYGCSRADLYVTSLMDFHRGWRQRANELSETTKMFLLFGTYVARQHGFRYYGKAMNLVRQLTAAYDAVLHTYDLLLMPTLPVKATPLPTPDASREEYVQRARKWWPTRRHSTAHITLPCQFPVECGTACPLA